LLTISASIINLIFKIMARLKKGAAVWVKDEDYYKAVKAVTDAGITSMNRVSVRYFDTFTFVVTAFVSIILGIILGLQVA